MRVGIMSFAHLHAESYLSILRRMQEVTVIGVADDNLERGRYFAEQFGVHLFERYEALLKEKPDAVVICLENARHLPLVEMAASAGAHVLCEKPLATSVADAQRIVEVCQKAGVRLMTAFPMRFSAPVLEVKKLLDAGSAGSIYGCNTTNQGALPEFHQQENLSFLKRDWFVDPRLAGGGAVTDHVVHLADLLRWLLKSEVTEVFAETSQVLHRGRVKVETAGLVMLTFANGTFASIDCSWSKPSYYPTWGGLKMELVSERGLITVDAFRQYSSVYTSRNQRPIWSYWGSDANQGMLEEFITSIRENRSPLITGEDGLKGVQIVAAAYESSRTGQPIAL
jgi:predicted dehydrogenase